MLPPTDHLFQLKSTDVPTADTPTEEPEADNTTGSSKFEALSNVRSLASGTVRVETRSFAPRVHNMDNDTWNNMVDAKFETDESTGFLRMRQFKRTKIITPTPVEKPVDTKPKVTGDGDTAGTGTNPGKPAADEASGVPSMGSDLGTPKAVDPHTDMQRWQADERKYFEQLEKQRNADNHRAVLAKIAEIEQQQAQRAGDDREAVLARVAKFEQAQTKRAEDNHGACMAGIAKLDGQVATKADKEQLDQQSSDFASLAARTDKVEKDTARLETRLETQQNGMSETVRELRDRVDDLENPVPIAGTEQPQAETDGHDPKELTVLITKAEGHDERLDRIETALGPFNADMMQDAFEWFEWANGNFKTCAESLGKYEATHEGQGQLLNDRLAKQKENFEHEMRQQKEATAKEFKDLKKSMQEEMRLEVSSIRKEYEEQLASKDKELAEQRAKSEAERKEQKQRYDNLESKVDQILSQINSQNAIPQSANPVQGQPQTRAPPQQPNPRASTPTAPAQGQAPAKSGAQMGGIPSSGDGVIDLDTEMGDAPSEPPKQHSRQPSQADVPMASVEPINPNNNGNAGFARGSQPMGRNRPLNGTGLVQPIFQAPAPSAPPAQGLNNSAWNGPIATGTGPSTPAPHARPDPTENRGERLQRPSLGFGRRTFKLPAGQRLLPDPTATPSKTAASSTFGYNGAPPTVNKPQMNWEATMEKVNFDPPADMDIDDDVKPLQTMAQQPLAITTPATPWAAQPAPNNSPSAIAGGDDTVMTDGSSSNAGGSSSTPSMPQAPAPTKPSAPKPAKKKVDPFIKKKPGTTPSKPAEVTSMAQATQSKIASFAQKRQAAFASEFGSAPTPKAILQKGPSPSAAPSEFFIPGLTGAVNTSPFALKPKTPAPAPQPASPAFTPVVAAPKPVPQASPPVSPAYKPQSAAYSPTSPTYQPASPPLTPPAASPAAQAPTSPLANQAATSDTIESATATNVFMKEVENPVEQPSEGNDNSAPEAAMGDAGDAAAPIAESAKPSGNAGEIQMSGAESEPEVPKKGEFEVDKNRLKHAAPEQMVPSDDAKVHRGDAQGDAKAPKSDSQATEEVTMENSQDEIVGDDQDPQGDVPMQTDRPMMKAKGKAKKLGEAETKRQMNNVKEESSWDEMGKAFEYQKAQEKKKAAAEADDEVDYADPNDVNDEDIHNTTMETPTPNFRPTKYSVSFFQGWKDHFLSWNHLSKQAIEFKCETEGGVKYFVDEVRKLDAKHDLNFLLHWASLPNDMTAFTRIEMEKLFDTFREETFYQALREMELDDLDPYFSVSRNLLGIDKTNWFKFHRPDAF